MTTDAPRWSDATVIVLEAGPELGDRIALITAQLAAHGHDRLIVVDTTGSRDVWTFMIERLPHARGRVDYYRIWHPADRAGVERIRRALAGLLPAPHPGQPGDLPNADPRR